MHPVEHPWEEFRVQPPLRPTPRRREPGRLASEINACLWRADQLVVCTAPTIATGWPELDAELPGGGWPCQSLTELLQPQLSGAEFRLLGAAMRQVAAAGKDIVLVGPPQSPHWPGLMQMGVEQRRLVWIQAETPAERLWVTEQLIKANAAGLLLVWLTQVRHEQIRRLQVLAHSCDGPVILCRTAAAAHESSAAPLRVHARCGVDWELQIQILKRKGALREGTLCLASVPSGLDDLITPRLRKPSLMLDAASQCVSARRELADGAVARPGRRTTRPVLI